MRPRLLVAVALPSAVLTALVILFNAFFALHTVREYSMEPVLREGQVLLVLRRTGKTPPYKPGDILVYKSPQDRKMVVKRCVLVAGDPLDIRHGWLYTTRGRFYLSPEQKDTLAVYLEIPPESLFAVGDNPLKSVDSRTYGFIPLEDIEGRVIFPRKRCPRR